MQKIHLRHWQDSDLSSLLKYANNPRIAANLTDRFPHPYQEENGKAFIEMAKDFTHQSVFAIDLGGEAIGGIGLHPLSDVFRKNAELGYWIGEPFWGQGIISQAIPLIVAYGFEQLDINRIFARPFGRNVASQKALEKCGFVLEAIFKETLLKNGEYEDEYVYGIRREKAKY